MLKFFCVIIFAQGWKETHYERFRKDEQVRRFDIQRLSKKVSKKKISILYPDLKGRPDTSQRQQGHPPLVIALVPLKC